MSHTLAKLTFHCIFSTKNRHPSIGRQWQSRLYAYIGGILGNCGGKLISAGGTSDHVHLLFELDAVKSVSDTLRLIKTNSSKWIHESFPEHAQFAWQTGYAAFSVSASTIDDVVRYIDHQEEHHRVRPFDEELAEFARRHGMEFDSKDST